MNKSKTVLIVDQDTKIRKKIRQALEGDLEYTFDIYDVDSIEGGETVLKRDRRSFRLVLIHWYRWMDIFDALLTLGMYFPDIKIVYTTHATIKDSVIAMKSGANNYIDIDAPNFIEDLLETVKEEIKARPFDDNKPDPEWLDAHARELRMKYPSELLAFIDGEVVEHGKTEKELLEKLKRTYPDKSPFIMYAPMEIF